MNVRSGELRQETCLALDEQLEDLLDHVWRCEAGWRFDDRLELAVRLAVGTEVSSWRQIRQDLP